jgi:hypothetical protein
VLSVADERGELPGRAYERGAGGRAHDHRHRTHADAVRE